MSPADFDEINISREKANHSRKFRLRRYDVSTRILIITIPTSIHEHLHGTLRNTLIVQFAQRGLTESWSDISSTTFRSLGHPRGNGGEGDSAGGPIPERIGTRGWPTLVIEAGDSESLSELHVDMRWWFAISDHQVKIVILAKFDHAQHTIFLEKWEEVPLCAPRPGATTTRHAAALQPVRQQSITITQNATTNPATYLVTSGPLVLSFRLLFLRAPGPLQEDFVISVAELEAYARQVWLSTLTV